MCNCDKVAARRTSMITFTIDPDNKIATQTGTAPTDGVLTFTHERELASISKDWPLARFSEVWNRFAGVTPFDDLKPIKKFLSRKTATAKIWNAVQRLSLATEGAGSAQARPTPSSRAS